MHTNHTPFIQTWIRERACEECGTLSRRRILMRRDGGKHYSGLANLQLAKIQKHLDECAVLCVSCRGIRCNHGPTTAAIREALLSFKTSLQIQRELHTDGKRISRIADQLFTEGHKCKCGKKLRHPDICPFTNWAVRRPHYELTSFSFQFTSAPATTQARCTADKSCPLPPKKDGLCSHHLKFFEFDSSLYGASLDMGDFFNDNIHQHTHLRFTTRREMEQLAA